MIKIGYKILSLAVALWAVFFVPLASSATKSSGYQVMEEAYKQVGASMRANSFNEPLHINSAFGDGVASGEIYALIDKTFPVVSTHLINIAQWCDMLVLHVNVKGCSENKKIPDESGIGVMTLYVGRNYYQTIEDAHAMQYELAVNQRSDDYFTTTLSSKSGPFGTSDYKLIFEAIPLTDKTTFIHFKYSYKYGILARVALSGYLATLGRAKVGFTVDKYDQDHNPVYVKGMQGVVERNVMRYFIAIRTYLDTYALKEDAWNVRVNQWYTLALPYKKQLIEVKDKKYLETKRQEFENRKNLESGKLKLDSDW